MASAASLSISPCSLVRNHARCFADLHLGAPDGVVEVGLLFSEGFRAATRILKTVVECCIGHGIGVEIGTREGKEARIGFLNVSR